MIILPFFICFSSLSPIQAAFKGILHWTGPEAEAQSWCNGRSWPCAGNVDQLLHWALVPEGGNEVHWPPWLPCSTHGVCSVLCWESVFICQMFRCFSLMQTHLENGIQSWHCWGLALQSHKSCENEGREYCSGKSPCALQKASLQDQATVSKKKVKIINYSRKPLSKESQMEHTKLLARITLRVLLRTL